MGNEVSREQDGEPGGAIRTPRRTTGGAATRLVTGLRLALAISIVLALAVAALSLAIGGDEPE